MISVNQEIIKEINFICVSILFGNAMVFLYDILRIFRRLIKHKTLVIALEDILYWIISAFLIFCMFYQENDGLLRGFAIGAVILGMILYNHFVSRWLVKNIAGVLLKVIRLLQKPCRIVFHKWNRLQKKMKNILKKVVKLVKMGLCKL